MRPVVQVFATHNGGFTCGTISPSKRRLDVQNRLERCIFCNPYMYGTSGASVGRG